MTDRKNPISGPRSQKSLRASLPNISQLTSHESMNGIPMTLNTLVLEKQEDSDVSEDTIDWKNLYLKSRRQSMSIRSQYKQAQDRLIKEKLALRRGNKLLQSALTQSRCNASKMLAEKSSIVDKVLDNMKQKMSEKNRLTHLLENRLDDLEIQCKELSARASAADEAKEQSDKFAKLARTQLKHSCEQLSGKDHIITNLKKEKEELQLTLHSRNVELVDLDHVLEVYSEVVEGILKRKSEWSKSPHRRDIKIIEKGNKVAHGGTCLADAYRIKSTCDNDLEWYKEYYGTTPDVVLQFESSAAFRRLINMRYEVYRYKHNIGNFADVYEEDFQKLLEKILHKARGTESMQSILVGNTDTETRRAYFDLCIMWEDEMAQEISVP
ncbi:uncharacterized protein EAF01_007262 [Botrytis porri]|uniref:Uncharacterized protein n=1 Tax=Botrytis porri TaxID=87229 RepID=A0A4Z1KH79_9HELO|nr:uncharacterized protein EAF01_007262 [Botrytis porri]KAF7901964.1 hypothetical protein EAF01_007262 [Botrytis porri]TGO85441.1 hypothetical protein BPOR_0396g00130 [Botrytis porri]